MHDRVGDRREDLVDLEKLTVDAETISDTRDRLGSLHAEVDRLGATIATADGLVAAVRARAAQLRDELDLEDRAEADAAVAAMESAENHATSVRGLAALLRRTRERRVERLARLSEIVLSIAELASPLSSSEIAALRAQATELFTRYDGEGLSRLRAAVELQVATASVGRQKTIIVAETVLGLLDHVSSVGAATAARCLDAVRAGDAKLATSALWSEAPARVPPKELEPSAPAPTEEATTPSPQRDLVPASALDRFEPRNAITAEYLRRRRATNRSIAIIQRSLEDEVDHVRAVQLAAELVDAAATTSMAAEAVFRLLELRGVEELARGSVLGAVEHGLDIAELASRGKVSGEPWVRRGAALLALVPPQPSTSGTWARQAANAAREILANTDPLPLALERLFGAPSFGQAVAERFTHAAFRGHVRALAEALYAAAVQDAERAHVRDELALGVANGTSYGGDEVVRNLLIELATAGGVEDQDRVRLRALLGQASSADKRSMRQLDRHVLGRLPDWLQIAIDGYLTTRTSLNESPFRAVDADKIFVIKVPKSVSEAGGFVFREGDRSLQVALNASTALPNIFNAELLLRASENREWLERDLVVHIGSLLPDASSQQQRQLLQLSLPLARELRPEDTSLTVAYSCRWMESETAKSRPPQARTVNLPLTRSRRSTTIPAPRARRSSSSSRTSSCRRHPFG